MGFKGREKALFKAAALAYTEMRDPFQADWRREAIAMLDQETTT